MRHQHDILDRIMIGFGINGTCQSINTCNIKLELKQNIIKLSFNILVSELITIRRQDKMFNA